MAELLGLQWKGVPKILLVGKKQDTEQYTYYKMIPVVQKSTHVFTYTKKCLEVYIIRY